jgi:alpha-galactosidase
MLTIFNWTDKPPARSIEFTTLGLAGSNQLGISDVLDGKAIAIPNLDSFVVDMPTRSARVIKIVRLAVPARPPAIQVEHVPPAKTGAAVTFRVQPASPNDAVISYRWSFGDGVTLEGPEVSHAYTKPGTYQVVVTAIGLGGLLREDSFRLPVSGSVSTRFVPAEKHRYRPIK